MVRMKKVYRPTPSQFENDLARLGFPVLEKDPDGSPPEELIVANAIELAVLKLRKGDKRYGYRIA